MGLFRRQRTEAEEYAYEIERERRFQRDVAGPIRGCSGCLIIIIIIIILSA